jgi:hypothetical protein
MSLSFRIKANTLLAILDATRELTTSVNFRADKTGVRMKTTGNDLHSMVTLDLEPGQMEEFSCPEPRTIGINVKNFYTVLKAMCLQEEDRVMILKRETEQFIRVISERARSEKLDEFTVRCEDVEEEPLVVPDLKSKMISSIPAKEIATLFKEIFHLTG